MTYDLFVPPELLKLQSWFSQAITHPLNEMHLTSPITASGEALSIEAASYLKGNLRISPHKAIEIYNQLYWKKIINQLKNSYPLVKSLFDEQEFLELLAYPYLKCQPSRSWKLHEIGDLLPQWINENYCDTDLNLVLRCAKLDLAYKKAYYSPVCASIEKLLNKRKQSLLNLSLKLQPHITLLEYPYNLVLFREQILSKPSKYWSDHNFPKLHPKQCFFIIYKNLNNQCCSKEITEAEFTFLSLIEKRSLKQCCEWIEKEDFCIDYYEENLKNWVTNWVRNKWLVPNA